MSATSFVRRLLGQAVEDAAARRMHLDWHPFMPESRPPGTTCFFSDGCATYYAGFYTSDGGVLVVTPAGHLTALSAEQVERVRFWAAPGNFIAATGAWS